jgi:hypothetical protein
VTGAKGEKGDTGEAGATPSSTDVLPEGLTNLYFTAARAIAALASTLSGYVTTAAFTWANLTGKPSFSTVATSGSYADLSNKPTIPAAQVNSDWNASSGVAQILNKPTIPAAQVNSDWNASSGIAQILNNPYLTRTSLIFDDTLDSWSLIQSSDLLGLETYNYLTGETLYYLDFKGRGWGQVGDISIYQPVRLYEQLFVSAGISAEGGIFEFRGPARQLLRVYGTYTNDNNYRRLDISSTSSGIFTLTATGLGTGASGNVLKLTAPVLIPSSSVTLATNGDLAFQATSNTTLTIRYRGSDGTTRSANLTLA